MLGKWRRSAWCAGWRGALGAWLGRGGGADRAAVRARSRHGRALVDRALYLPKEWAGDGARRAEVRVPGEVAFTTKPKLGLLMLERARAAGLPFSWVAGDSVYGADHAIVGCRPAHRAARGRPGAGAAECSQQRRLRVHPYLWPAMRIALSKVAAFRRKEYESSWAASLNGDSEINAPRIRRMGVTA